MKEFEKFLIDLPKPAVEVPQFRARLRRELLGAAADRTVGSWRLVALLAGAMATSLVVALGLFVARPGIPLEIHAALSGSSRTVRATAHDPEAPGGTVLLDADRAFVDSWTARQAHSVEVRSMEDERLFSVRQFELTDGKRMLVFTELGNAGDRSTAMRATSPGSVF